LINRNQVAINKAMGGKSRARVRRRQQQKGPPQQYRVGGAEEVPVDDTLTKNLSQVVVDLMGEVNDRFKIEQFVNRLHSSDLAVIREWIADNSPGIETGIYLTDEESGQEFRVILPITESFFRPQESGRV
jgi:hypothetical protein